MLSNELTKSQQAFAEANHGLIFKFISEKALPTDDYYDVVVFGYLRAVRQYFKREDLRRRYAFDSIAYSNMADDLYSHHRRQSRNTLASMTVSYESIGKESGCIPEAVSGDEYMLEKLEAKLLWERLSRLLTHEQVRTLRLRADGYTDREIAARRKSQISDVESIFEEIQSAALGLCLA